MSGSATRVASAWRPTESFCSATLSLIRCSERSICALASATCSCCTCSALIWFASMRFSASRISSCFSISLAQQSLALERLRKALCFDVVVRAQEVFLEADRLADLAHGPLHHLAEADFRERLAVGDVREPHRILVDRDVVLAEAVLLGVQVAGDQRVQRFLERADAVGAAHRESDHE